MSAPKLLSATQSTNDASLLSTTPLTWRWHGSREHGRERPLFFHWRGRFHHFRGRHWHCNIIPGYEEKGDAGCCLAEMLIIALDRVPEDGRVRGDIRLPVKFRGFIVSQTSVQQTNQNTEASGGIKQTNQSQRQKSTQRKLNQPIHISF